ncbi:hypothetical protein NC651_018036 [Populus alba x Populus x berolinensis]|nr:hypothetical protein NC651_018036 [Populus alba x Populus x berolinensis]
MSRVSFARVMVEVTLTNDLPCSIRLSMPDGTIINQKVIYEYKPRFCSNCRIAGHTTNVYQKLHLGAEGGEKPKLSSQHDDSTQYDYDAIGDSDAVHMVLYRETSNKFFTTYSDLPSPLALHTTSSGTIITISDDSSGFDSIAKGNPEFSSIAKFTYRTLSKDMPSAIGHGCVLFTVPYWLSRLGLSGWSSGWCKFVLPWCFCLLLVAASVLW